MKARIYVKGENGKREVLAEGEFKADEWARFKSDWEGFRKDQKPDGGAYAYLAPSLSGSGDSREMLIQFADFAGAC